MRCKNCGVCCINTEMLLSNQDIKRLTEKGYPKEHFVQTDEDGYAQLRNIHGHCIFYDMAKRRCIVYEDRPEGCQIYPVIFDEERGIILDGECNATETITDEEKQEKGKKVVALLERIDKQARSRASNSFK